MILQCKVCKSDFRTYPSKVAQGRGKYCSKACSNEVTLIKKGQRISTATEFKPNQKPHNYRGYRLTKARKDGRWYKMIYAPSHPYSTKQGYVREHRLVMEGVLGRYLRSDEVVDHINMNETLNNDPSNLRVMTKREHDRMNTPLNIHRRWYEANKSAKLYS